MPLSVGGTTTTVLLCDTGHHANQTGNQAHEITIQPRKIDANISLLDTTHCGNNPGILTDTNMSLPHVPNNWWMKVRKFLQYIQGSLQIENKYVIQPLQERDQGIMDHALTQG